jgi:mRNA interferase MazF
MHKNFDEWNEVKKKIDLKQNRPISYHEGDIWWINMGTNIGVENNGKGINFGRPVLVIKKINYFSCLVIPLSSKRKEGYFYREFTFKNIKNTLLFNQIRIVDTSRFIDLIGEVSENKLRGVKSSFVEIFK